MNNSKGWKAFLAVVSLALFFGLYLRDKQDIPAEETLEEPVFADNISLHEMAGSSLPDSGEVRREMVLMGSQFVFIVDAPMAQALEAITAAANAIKSLEMQLTSWRPDSDVARLNESAGLSPVEVGKHTLHLLTLSKAVSQKTGGSFDVTIGPVWDLWPFREPHKGIPTAQEIENHLPLVDADSIVISERGATAFLPKQGMKVNLGAIGKGYAAEIAINTMKDMGIKRAAVSAGGDLYLLGKKNSGPWLVSIEHPRWPGRYLAEFFAGDVAVATTGDAMQYLVREGKRYGHVIDPNSGRPVDDCQSVTVATASASLADAYATAVFVMGTEKGLAWVEQQDGVEALIVDNEGLQHRSSGWQQFTERGMKTLTENAATDSAVTKLLQGPQPVRRSQVVSQDILAEIEESNRLAKTIAQKGTSDPKNISRMVRIPKGDFLSGDEKRRVMTVSDYWLDVTEVSNGQYRRFLDADTQEQALYAHRQQPANNDYTPRYWNNYRSPYFEASPAATVAPFDQDTFRQTDKPVVGIDWWDAYAFCQWSGKRLPSEHEWEKGARGDDGRIWPWGNEWDFARANTGGDKWGEVDGYIYAAEVVSFGRGASPYGVLNMAGNVAEWTTENSVMGGSSNNPPSGVRTSAKKMIEKAYRSFNIGFRCAADV